MGRAASQFGTLIMAVVAIVVFVYAMRNPNVKAAITGLLNQLKGMGGGGQQQQQQLPVTPPAPQPQPAQSPGPITPATPSQVKYHPYSSREGPGTRSQDPVTLALNKCAGTTGQEYLDCVNSAAVAHMAFKLGLA